MQDTHAYDGRIDRDCFEESPSCGYREVARIMHTPAAHFADGESTQTADILEGIDLEDDESMLHEPTTDPEVSAWS